MIAPTTLQETKGKESPIGQFFPVAVAINSCCAKNPFRLKFTDPGPLPSRFRSTFRLVGRLDMFH